jgi:hypothetical protein
MKRVFCLLMVFALGACGERWEKPGATQADFKSVKSGCIYHAAEKFPPDLHQVLRAPAYATPSHAGCFGSADITDCVRSQSVLMPPSYEAVDYNEVARNKDVRSCLLKNGWEPVVDD